MNYTKKEVSNRRKKLHKKRSKGKRAHIYTLLKIFTVTLLIVIALGLGGVAVYINRLIETCPDISQVDISPDGFKTHVYDKNGVEIETLAGSGANREYVTLDTIPLDLQHAFVAIEDGRFYTHNGIDPVGIIRVGVDGVLKFLKGGQPNQGASTITQQLLKNNYFSGWTSERTFKDRLERKIKEQYLAIQLEKVTTKENILENYLNTINLGHNTLGVQSASMRYFNKDVSQLTLSESTVIAGITQNPTAYDPITSPENNASRRKAVLDAMLKDEYITKAQYDEVLRDDVYGRIAVLNSELASSTTSYFVDALCEQVVKDLVEQLGYSETDAYSKLYSGGLTIYSTQDPRIQQICDEEINNQENYGGTPLYSFSFRLSVQKPDGTMENFSEQTMLSYYQNNNKNYNINFKSEEEAREAIEKYKAEVMSEGDTIPENGETISITLQPQTAISIIDQSNGQVNAIVGGRGEKTASRTLNRATNVTRQPGSTFKIVAGYAAGIDAGGMGTGTVIDDAPMTYDNGTALKNYDNQYRGFTTIRTAIAQSINVVAVKTLSEIGTDVGLKYATELGITTLQPSDNIQALVLGGLTYGVTNVDLTTAYATIANGGVYNRPVFYTQVLDYSGNIILDTTTAEPKRVLKETTAFMLTSCMRDVVTAGTGGLVSFPGMAIAGKTGTTTSNRDTVFAGFTPYYTAAIWGGFDDNAIQQSTNYSKIVWRSIMSRIHKELELPYKDFPVPSGVSRVSICTKSGKLAVEGLCDMDPRGSMVRSEYFASGTVPTEPCDHHVELEICTDSGLPASPYCPLHTRQPGIFIIGGSPGTADAEILLTDTMLETMCTVHSRDNYDPTRPVDVQVLPINPDGTTPSAPNNTPNDTHPTPSNPNSGNTTPSNPPANPTPTTPTSSDVEPG